MDKTRSDIMAVKIKINERADKLKDVERAIRSQIQNILENWCLIRQAELDSMHDWDHHHWIDELRDNINECLEVIESAPYSAKAIAKRIDEAFYTNFKADNNLLVYNKLRRKLIDTEGLTPEQLHVLADAWCSEGILEVIKVLKGETDPVDYILSKRAKAPYREPRKR